jgi:hypothetical protein
MALRGRHRWNCEGERRSRTIVVLGPELSSVIFHYIPTDRESDAHAPALGSEEARTHPIK